MIDPSEGIAREIDLQQGNHSQAVEDWETDRVDGEYVAPYYKRRLGGVWAVLAALIVLLAISVIYGHAILQREGIQLAQIPEITKSLSVIGEDLTGVQRRLGNTRADQQKLVAQLQSIDAGSRAALHQAREQMNKIAHEEESLLKNLNQQTSVFQVKLAQLKSERDADLLRLAQVEGQLVQARHELEDTRTDYNGQVAVLRENQGEEHRELASISNSLSSRRIVFELHKNQEKDVVPGVALYLTKIDARHQRYEGWIESAPNNQKVRIHNQGVRSPIAFYSGEGAKPFVMVVTSIDQNGAAGYLLLPASNGIAGQTDFISSTDTQATPSTVPSSSSVAGPAN